MLITDNESGCMHFAPLTFFVLSMALRIDMFRSSKAARTFSYSPRCWEKYSGGVKNRKKQKMILWAKQARRSCGCFFQAASGWRLSRSASKGFDCRACQYHEYLVAAVLEDTTQQAVFSCADEQPTYRRVHLCPRCWKRGEQQWIINNQQSVRSTGDVTRRRIQHLPS